MAKVDTKDEVDEVLWCVGPRGRYQILQYGYIMICQLSVAFSILVYVFIGYAPPHGCRTLQNYSTFNTELENASTMLRYGKCEIEVVTNSTNSSTVLKTLPCDEGYDFHTESDRTIVTEWNLVCSSAGLAELSQTLITVGQMIGATFFTSLSDRFGRKPVLVSTHIMMLVSTIVLAFVPVYPAFAAVRILIGVIQEGLALVCSCLSIEIFPKEYRGAITAVGTIWWAVCVTVLTPFGYFLRNHSWRYVQLATALIALPSLFGYWVIDESIRWLIANKKLQEAERVVKRAARLNGAKLDPVLVAFKNLRKTVEDQDKEAEEITETVLNDATEERENTENVTNTNNVIEAVENKENATDSKITEEKEKNEENAKIVQRYTILSLFRNRHLIRVSVIVWYTWCVNSLTYYGLFLTSSTFAGDRFLNYFLSGLVELPSAFVFWAIVNRIGRKRTSIFFHGITGLSLIISVVLLVVEDDNGVAKRASTAFSLIGKFAITGSWTTIYLSTPEMYPTNLRNAAFGMASAAARIGGMAAPYSSFLAAYATWAPGVVFGSCCLLVTLLTLTLPETRKKELPLTLTDAIALYKGEKKSKTKTENK